MHQNYYYWSINARNMEKIRKWHSNYKITILPLEAMLLDLISKNYHKFIISCISWICNLYINLTLFKARNNRVYPKAIKLRKLVTGATGHRSDIQRYEREASGGGYKMVSLYVANGGRTWRWSSRPRLAREDEREGNSFDVASTRYIPNTSSVQNALSFASSCTL